MAPFRERLWLCQDCKKENDVAGRQGKATACDVTAVGWMEWGRQSCCTRVLHRKGCGNDGADSVAVLAVRSQCQGAALQSGMTAEEERAREYDAKRRCTHSWNGWPTLPDRQRGYFQRKKYTRTCETAVHALIALMAEKHNIGNCSPRCIGGLPLDP